MTITKENTAEMNAKALAVRRERLLPPEKKRSKFIAITISPSENEMLTDTMKRFGLSRAELVVRAVSMFRRAGGLS